VIRVEVTSEADVTRMVAAFVTLPVLRDCDYGIFLVSGHGPGGGGAMRRAWRQDGQRGATEPSDWTPPPLAFDFEQPQPPERRVRAMHGEAANLLAEATAEIARLTAELDGRRDTPVEYVPTAGIEAAMAADPNREDGAVLREMGGQRRAWAWRVAAGEWGQVT